MIKIPFKTRTAILEIVRGKMLFIGAAGKITDLGWFQKKDNARHKSLMFLNLS